MCETVNVIGQFARVNFWQTFVLQMKAGLLQLSFFIIFGLVHAG